ncbi:hypothetical protein I6A84_08390, partial [Frankia sp. CNm7]|uniref:phage tail protein n=1 Tax=Frankia nepalensis TaxID=1836974 RepID=UPI001D5BE345
MTDVSVRRRALELLPAFYRERDARPDGRPGFLESLLTVIREQFALVEDDLDALYDDLFVETCAPWVIPYLGDLVGVAPGAPTDAGGALTRAAVADAIALRRRKGTVPALEQVARDVTGWPALAVEMFQRLAVTPHLAFAPPARPATFSARSAARLERLGGAFDPAARTLDARRIGSGHGRHGPANAAVLVWRDLPLARTLVDAHPPDAHRVAQPVDGAGVAHPDGGAGVVRPVGGPGGVQSAGARRFRFSPLGVDTRLATRPATEIALGHRASPLNVPGPIGRRGLAAAVGDHYGPGRSIL